jgi:DNA-binding GntR family transcriptional regulator
MATPARLPSEASIGSPLAKGIDTTRLSSGDQAALYIRRLIFDGDLRPGTRVPQDEIAHTLGVSRIPVREALIALEREGWVTIELYRGAFINALDADTVRDHYELYGLVFGLAARRALARSVSTDLLDRLEDLADALQGTTAAGEVTQLTVRFHRTVADAARSSRIKVVIRAMSALVPGDFFSLVPDAIDIERQGLQAIAQAMREGDGERAAGGYADMMRNVGEKVVALFEDRRLFDRPAG